MELFVYRHKAVGDGRLLFQVDTSCEAALGEGDRRMFNILLLSDLEALFRQFDMVFFMDDGCFYSAGQTDKTVEEKMIVQQLEWMRTKARREERADKKLVWYLQEYEEVGKWLNGKDTDVTAELQFNEKLFRAIHNAASPRCAVYLYISQSGRIGDFDIQGQNVCNEENYDGRRMLVYKVPPLPRDSGEENANMQKLIGNSQTEVLVDVWKLVKSISNEYMDAFLERFELAEGEAVRLLKNCFLSIVPGGQGKNRKIIFRLKPAGEQADLNRMEKAEEFLRELLREGFQDPANPCVAVYLRRLVGDAVVSRAKNVGAVLLGYLLKIGYFDECVIWDGQAEDEAYCESTALGDGLSQTRRTVYTIMKVLNNYRLRDYDRREEFLLYEFRDQYCPGIDREVFVKLVYAIQDACETLGYEKSSLAAYSRIRGRKISWQR